tara:strand:+ start:112 stop:276 length:165 start_codon:yes stop_codon:yes gene_type:complete
MIKDIKINVGGEKIDFNTNDILNEVFKNHIKDLQKPERTKMPALDDDGKFVRYE